MNFKIAKTDYSLIAQVVDRAMALAERAGADYDRMTAHMDITACHANGCPLELAMLLGSQDSDFAHDIFGIARHIDRDTGKLRDSFMPRFAAVYHSR